LLHLLDKPTKRVLAGASGEPRHDLDDLTKGIASPRNA